MAMHLPPIMPFDLHGEPETVGLRWENWMKRFENYTVAFGITEDERKRALLLHYAGEAVHNLFVTLPASAAALTYDLTLEKLSSYFLPKKNPVFEVFKFKTAVQEEGESIEEYHIRLRRLASTCEFHDCDLEIKNHVIHTCTSLSLKTKALCTPNLTLEELITMAKTIDLANKQSQSIAQYANRGINQRKTDIPVLDVTEVSQIEETYSIRDGRYQNGPRTNGRRGSHQQPRNQYRQDLNFGHQDAYNTPNKAEENCGCCGGKYPHQGGRETCPAFNKK